ncbi:MAG TPA: nuclear transport factor 2 family protein [Jiangellales bacterium]|nr:nuclear transport factor 2 family protein [Jiangellales bacterium]
MAHPHADVLRGAYAARDRAEVAPLRLWLHGDVVWHAKSGDLHGPQSVMAMLAEADRIVGRTQSHEIHTILADDDYGVVLTTVRATRADVGRSYEDLHVHAYRFRDGRIIEFWGFLHDPQAAAEFWA